MASMLTKKAKTQDQSTALTYLPSESRSKIVAANQMCAAMNAARNAYAAMIKQTIDSRINIAPLFRDHPLHGTHTPPVRNDFPFVFGANWTLQTPARDRRTLI